MYFVGGDGPRHIARPVLERGEGAVGHTDHGGYVTEQSGTDGRSKPAAVGLLGAKFVDDQQIGRRGGGQAGLNLAHGVGQGLGVQPTALRMCAQGLADADCALPGQDLQVHRADCIGFVRHIALHGTGHPHATWHEVLGEREKQVICLSAPRDVHIAQHRNLAYNVQAVYQIAATDERFPMIRPDPSDPRLTRAVQGMDHTGAVQDMRVVEERPLTIYLNSQEIVTAMTIGDHPEYLAIGFLRNQAMLRDDDEITGVDYDDDLQVVVVRTARKTSYEEKMRKKTRTSGCAVGTVFGDMMEGLEGLTLPNAPLRASWLYALSREINTMPSLYLEAGAIHGTVLCAQDKPLIYMEDVGRHNAVDKVAGWMFRNDSAAADKILYTTGRLTSEMVIKTAHMGIPVLASRSGFTAWGVEIARQVNMTLIGRMRGKRFVCLSGQERLILDVDPDTIPDETRSTRRKGASA